MPWAARGDSASPAEAAGAGAGQPLPPAAAAASDAAAPGAAPEGRGGDPSAAPGGPGAGQGGEEGTGECDGAAGSHPAPEPGAGSSGAPQPRCAAPLRPPRGFVPPGWWGQRCRGHGLRWGWRGAQSRVPRVFLCLFGFCQASAQPSGLQMFQMFPGSSDLAPELSSGRLSGLGGQSWCCSDPSPAPPGWGRQQRPAGASPDPLPGRGDPPVGTRPPSQQCPGTGPLAGNSRVGPRSCPGGQGGVPLVAFLPPCAPQLIPALPQPRSPHPARAPAANPAAPRAVAEGAGSPGSRWTQGGGDWGIGREDTESVTASALEEPALPILGASTLRCRVGMSAPLSPCAGTEWQGDRGQPCLCPRAGR